MQKHLKEVGPKVVLFCIITLMLVNWSKIYVVLQ